MHKNEPECWRSGPAACTCTAFVARVAAAHSTPAVAAVAYGAPSAPGTPAPAPYTADAVAVDALAAAAVVGTAAVAGTASAPAVAAARAIAALPADSSDTTFARHTQLQIALAVVLAVGSGHRSHRSAAALWMKNRCCSRAMT